MNIFSFTAHFGSEEDCRLHFKEQRDKEGVVCKQIFDTELSLYRESVRREELILNEQTNDELQNLKIEIKRKDLKIAELEKEIKKIKEGK
jgi:hypothetical protein